MLQKLLGKFATINFPYWCPYCPSRFRKEAKFHKHYLVCEARQAKVRQEEIFLRSVAPVNRDQRRKMAKRAGKIKDWAELNAD
jgi:hypothetical protein